jgi:hypothetical protein
MELERVVVGRPRSVSAARASQIVNRQVRFKSAARSQQTQD